MRTIPNDKFQTKAMITLLSHYGWNWVGIIATDGSYGLSALDHFVSQAAEKGICVAFKCILTQSVTSQDASSAITQAAETIFKNPKAQVIVSFAKPTHMKFLFHKLKSMILERGANVSLMRRVWVASDTWSVSNSVPGDLTLDEIGYVMGFTFKSGDMTSFNKYMDRLGTPEENSRDNIFMQDFYLHVNETIGGSEDDKVVTEALEILRKHIHPDLIFNVEMAVSAITHAVAAICKSRDCKTPGNLQPWQVFTYTPPRYPKLDL